MSGVGIRTASPSAAQLVLVGVRQCLASGQQNSVALHTLSLGANEAAIELISTWKSPAVPSAQIPTDPMSARACN